MSVMDQILSWHLTAKIFVTSRVKSWRYTSASDMLTERGSGQLSPLAEK